MKHVYSSYRDGLEIGDLVYFKLVNLAPFTYTNSRFNVLVLDREFLYSNDTRYGIRSFFKYKFLNTSNNRVFDIETKNIRVLKTFKIEKGSI